MAEPRIGVGVDVHAFGPASSTLPLRLAGLTWPEERALAGHSDGDVAAHAIVDAVASAAGLGDIGTLFGTADPQWEGASGLEFLAHLRQLVDDAGQRVGNVAVQIVGNRPRVAERRTQAEAALAGALGAPVNVSGTTADGLGLTGRGEGLAAIATALVFQ
ncbi:MAG: 2-C-methyl-D-erythritol 2,4-cyclodiphosphate synthase [Bifidobacteriaceae bacterium]|jgi:2-C-methyl-D-erythritol 2,4-cyclodiphosphate synthase|nr:2-C-methyl-D-erythritol 2,4-cyclodiphosphate synthase [Bifidobacteriaceae bacterium]